MNYVVRSLFRAFIALALCLAISGCGGGGGGHNPQPVSRPGTLQFSGSLSVDENAGTAQLTITRTEGSDGAVSVTVASGDSSAHAGQDYTALFTTVTFAAGDTAAKTVTVPIAEDTLTEADETFFMTLGDPTGGAQRGPFATVIVTIRDNDPASPQPGTLQFTGSISVEENAGTVQLTITRTEGSDGEVSATVASGDASAHAGQDYTALFTTVTFAAGDTAAKTVIVPIAEDTLTEADETFVVLLTDPTGGVQLGPFSTVIVTIRDNDPPAAGEPAAPTVTVSATTKQLTFNWTSVPGATRYRLLRNPDGASGFTQVGADYPSDAVNASVEVAVHRHDWVNTLYRVEACNNFGCVGSNPVSAVDAMVRAIGYFKASNTDPFDQFGYAVALSADGRTLAVGAPFEDSIVPGIDGDPSNDGGLDNGAVYIFTREGPQWSQQAYVKASNASADDLFPIFGVSVALSADGSTLAVGASGEGSDAFGSGAVYVFTRTGEQWSQQAYVKASNAGAADGFGLVVALSADGGTLAVGAPFESSSAMGVNGNQANDAAGEAGAVYVFTRDGAEWSQQAYIKASNTAADDEFGISLALSGDGNTLAVGAWQEDSSAMGVDDPANDDATDSGAVYVFTRDGAVWSQQAYVKASNTRAFDRFGVSLALSADGDTLAVGASTEDSDAKGVDGDQTNDEAPGSGAVYVFARNGMQWSQQAYLKASNTETGDEFGIAVALSADGSMLAVGATGEDSNTIGMRVEQGNNSAAGAGAVYVFTRDATQWSRPAYVKPSNTNRDDTFGFALALSADGSTLAVGARLEDSETTGVLGANQANNAAPSAGAVYVF